jgi:hypothetical protein
MVHINGGPPLRMLGSVSLSRLLKTFVGLSSVNYMIKLSANYPGIKA